MTKHSTFILEEPLIFEQGSPGRRGVDLPSLSQNLKLQDDIKGYTQNELPDLPDLSEPQVVRHYTRLSQMNYGIDSVFYPLGSCTMKHNPRLNEKMARLSGFSQLHPLQPEETVQGALELVHELMTLLKTLTGMSAISMNPGAGAHGEFCGLAVIQAAHQAKGRSPKRVLIPESAHGTNPATAASLGYTVDTIPATDRGRVDSSVLAAKLGDDVAALMLTNPNTCGLFENDILSIAEQVHQCGAYFYCDGANFNAIVGRVRPAELGIDAMHINLHKTFSTPHGGGGPGSGPVVLRDSLAPFAPYPFVKENNGRYSLHEKASPDAALSIGRIKGFHRQMGMFIRALAYILSHGSDGLWQVATDAVLNANYLLASLKDLMSPSFPGYCMHEALFDDRFLKDTGVTTLDLAKALLDRGYHPMTMYFPLVVHGALLIEPTETENKETLDGFIETLRELITHVKKNGPEEVKRAPHTTPRRRLDETKAARQPILKWTKKGEGL